MKYTIFTYGTLMKGQRNHRYLEKSRYLCDGVLEDHELYDTEYDYPAAIKAAGHRVYGEVYKIDEKTKKEVDELEGVGYLYDCTEVTIQTESGKVKALFYEYLQATAELRPYTLKGKWIAYKDR